MAAQVFIERDGEHEFVGLWSDVESLNECEALPPDVRCDDIIVLFGFLQSRGGCSNADLFLVYCTNKVLP